MKQADADAEEAWKQTASLRDHLLTRDKDPALMNWLIQVSIAAELRAQRIARRPGAGQ